MQADGLLCSGDNLCMLGILETTISRIPFFLEHQIYLRNFGEKYLHVETNADIYLYFLNFSRLEIENEVSNKRCARSSGQPHQALPNLLLQERTHSSASWGATR